LAQYSSSTLQILAPIRAAGQRFGFAALVVVCLVIIALSKTDSSLIERARTLTSDAMMPILRVLAQPIAAARDGLAAARQFVLVYQDNERLRQENALLLQWQDTARRLDAENRALREVTRFTPGGDRWTITAQVVGASGGAFSRNLLIDRGAVDGVAKGQAALFGTALIGRVEEVGQRTARILLLTDPNSRIPVAVGLAHERAILAGDNSELPVLRYLAPNPTVHAGDRLVTSGDGGVFPPDLDIGVVDGTGTAPRVIPRVRNALVGYVRIVDFGLGGMLPPSAPPQPNKTQPRANP
jgi:rod shape-determining protein MreC